MVAWALLWAVQLVFDIIPSLTNPYPFGPLRALLGVIPHQDNVIHHLWAYQHMLLLSLITSQGVEPVICVTQASGPVMLKFTTHEDRTLDLLIACQATLAPHAVRPWGPNAVGVDNSHLADCGIGGEAG